jgi:hypothetical protein
MRSTATLTHLTFLTTLAVTVGAMPNAVASEARYHHSKAVMDVVEQQCAEGIGNDSFCRCAIEALNMYLPPTYASLLGVSVQENTYQFFDLHEDTPRYIEDQLYEATRHCREEFTDSTEPQ